MKFMIRQGFVIGVRDTEVQGNVCSEKKKVKTNMSPNLLCAAPWALSKGFSKTSLVFL